MSLLEKVESAAGTNLLELESDEGIRYRNMLKGLLYAYIPRSKIAQLISQDIELAAREVNGALEIAAMAPQFEQLSSDRLQALITEVADMVLGLGPLQSLLNDRSVTEIMVNGPRKVFFERDGKIHTSTAQFDDEKQLRTVIDKIFTCIFPVMAFVAVGAEHCVANMFFLPMGLAIKMSGIASTNANIDVLNIGGVFYNISAATVGNIIGGAILVAIMYWIAYHKKNTDNNA